MRCKLAAFLMLAVPTLAAAEDTVYKKALKSTVWIVQPVSREGNRVMLRTGSGSVIDVKRKLILTNYHVVEEIPDVIVCFPIFDKKGELIPEKDKYNSALKDIGLKGRVIAKDPTKDLAIIELVKDAPLPHGTMAVRMAKGPPEPSQKVHSIGSPGISGALFNYTGGEVKSVYHKDWRVSRMQNDPNPLMLSAHVIETSSATNKGDSGGPLLNDKCELVGVTQGMSVGGDDTRIVSYFIAVDEVRDLLKRNKIPFSTAGGTAVAAADKPLPNAPTATTSGNVTPMISDAERRERDAVTMLDFAKQVAREGKTEKARTRLEEIVKKFAGTKAADEAKMLLEKK